MVVEGGFHLFYVEGFKDKEVRSGGIKDGKIGFSDLLTATIGVIARFGVGRGGKDTISSIRPAHVLADPCPEPLSGASNIGGIAASTRKFVDDTRHQLSRQAVLESEDRTDGVRIGEGRKEKDLRVEGAEGGK